MHDAAEYNSTAVAELLIRSGADVHAKDEVSNISFGCIMLVYHILKIIIILSKLFRYANDIGAGICPIIFLC